uniref:Putative product n=1 Tax=Xenopsylla cheopis TaxID=163159 RepID=A0A6M2E221_XENCH
MSVFQFVNVLILLFEVIYGYIPNIWMTHEIPLKERKFSMGITALADSLGIAIAGWIAIPTHNALCTLPKL